MIQRRLVRRFPSTWLHGGSGGCGPLPTWHRRPSAQGFAEAVAAEAFDRLNAVKKADYMDFLKRKLGEWYRAAPKGLRPAPAPEVDESDLPRAGGDGAQAENGVSTATFTFPLV